ncbi:MAG: Gfo/Idh/MocA family oxidoreductase [bacterium]|jgi:predicted dehydrogenase|nr:Gfo/Idh/MocA family oxidoreductase [bacterium]
MNNQNQSKRATLFQREPSRRDFLKTGGSALVVTALTNPALFAADTAPRKIRMGIVGGGFGTSFQWHEHPDCVVAAVSDLREDRLANLVNTYKCDKTYPSLEELVKDPEIDAVGVFTDAPLHVQHVQECMKHGKHVISAVPACVATLEQAEGLLEAVTNSGLTYMMAETSYFQQMTISARKFFNEDKFGEIFYCESEYQHDGLDSLYYENGKKTWRYGLAPMHYPTHCTAHLVGVTGERLVDVTCHGWGDDSQILKDNDYNNPFWNQSALFRTDQGHSFRVNVWWKGAHRGVETARWIGTKMSFYGHDGNGNPPTIVRSGQQTEKDDAGFERTLQNFERYEQPQWWKTELLPEPLRHDSGHEGSHTFITHEFIDALVHNRRPAVDVYEALAYTVPGIIAHQSSLQMGKAMPIPQFVRPTNS